MSDPSQDKGATRADLLRVWGPIVLLGIAAFAYTFSKLEPPAPRELTLAAGGPNGAYFAFAHRYADYLAAHDFELKVLETGGSLDNLTRLESGEADLALLQGGVSPGAALDGQIESLGSLFFEPLWVFHRSDLEVERLTDLVGRRLAIGGDGSGTRVLASQLLEDNDVSPTTSEWLELGGAEAATALESGAIDAAFFVASASASYIGQLLAADGVEVLSLRRSRAYRVRYPFLSPVVLGEGVVDLDANLPARDIQMVAAATTLVAEKELHHALVPMLIDALESVHGGSDLFTEAGSFPSSRHVDVPLKSEAAHYLENGPSFLYRFLPYRTAAAVDRMKILILPFIPLLLVMFKLAPPLYRWRIRSRIYRWYEDLRELDHLLLKEPTPEQARSALERMEVLEKEITEVTVPLSYMDEFYSLRLHVELIERKLDDILAGARLAREEQLQNGGTAESES
ncbi:MAG: TAXI family TRAP transporter solute-binding subunit [Acidobacteriota bacterium]